MIVATEFLTQRDVKREIIAFSPSVLPRPRGALVELRMIRSVVDQFSLDKAEVIARRFIACWTDRWLYTVIDSGFY